MKKTWSKKSRDTVPLSVLAQQAILILSSGHVKSARSIYQQLELAVARSSIASAQAAFSFKLPSLNKSWPPQDVDQGQISNIFCGAFYISSLEDELESIC